MACISYYHNCSKEYVCSLSPEVHEDVIWALSHLLPRQTQAEINRDLWWLLTAKGWCYDAVPPHSTAQAPAELPIPGTRRDEVAQRNDRSLCNTTTTIAANWRADFARLTQGKLVQIEVQFGKVESMFKDFCGFAIAWHEKRLSLGVEVVMHEPARHFPTRKRTISGMAYFEVARKTLPAIGLTCPIWLVGIT